MSEIKNRIVKLRKSMNLSQEEFGKRIGLSKSGISNIENGKREISNTHIKIISAVFNVSEKWLRTGDSLSKTVKELETFLDYIKSLGYAYKCNETKIHNAYIKDEVDDNGNIIGRSNVIEEADYLFSLSKNGITAVFTEEEFKALQEKNKESLEGAILLQHQKNQQQQKQVSAATDE